MNSERSAATTCWIVRLAMTPLRPSFTISARRLAADFLVPVRREVVALDVRDAPLHEEVDVQDLALARQELLRGIVPRQHAPVEFLHRSSPGTMKCSPGSKSVAMIFLSRDLIASSVSFTWNIEALAIQQQDQQRDRRPGTAVRFISVPSRDRGSAASTSLPSSMRMVGGVSAEERCGAALLEQLVERQVDHVARAFDVDQDLGSDAEHLLHRLEVEALARHGRGALVLGGEREEARRLAVGIGDDAAAVGAARPRRR